MELAWGRISSPCSRYWRPLVRSSTPTAITPLRLRSTRSMAITIFCHKISCFSALIFDPAFDPAEVVGEGVWAGVGAQSATEASRDKNGKRISSLPKVELVARHYSQVLAFCRGLGEIEQCSKFPFG